MIIIVGLIRVLEFKDIENTRTSGKFWDLKRSAKNCNQAVYIFRTLFKCQRNVENSLKDLNKYIEKLKTALREFREQAWNVMNFKQILKALETLWDFDKIRA